MVTFFGFILVAGGIAVLAVARPWRSESDDDDVEDWGPEPEPRQRRHRPSPMAPRQVAGVQRAAAPAGRPRPKPSARRADGPAPRARRVPAEPGRPEIPLPEWLGPVSN